MFFVASGLVRLEGGAKKVADGVPGDGVGVLDGMALEPLSPDTVEAIRGWMARCGDSAGDEHKACSIAERDFAPARLVKLEEDAAGVRLSLVCGPCSSSCDSVEYAALSYCWGGSQEKQLTLANRAIYEKEIPWYSLPKALQDAATATLSLGLHYLWVDSLCIVQDDEEDKTTSISQMTKVYTHASITIINRRGDKVTDGFLHPRTHPHGSIYMRYNTENGAYGWATLTFDDTLLEGYRSAIDSRGWTMQEHLLSRRVVAVGPWITEWSCRTERLVHTDGWRFPSKREMSSGDILSTSLPNFLINKPFHDHDNNIKPISPDQLGNKYDADAVIFHFLNPNTYYQRPTQQSVKEIWRELVAAYSTRSLSVPSDLILAIAGLAEAFAPFISNSQRYLAGLWETELPASLLWMYDYRSTPRIRRPKTYQAPSWSWACIAAPIRHDYNLQGVPFWQDGDALNDHRPEYRFRCTATLLSISYSLANSIAPFGAVRSAALRIRGPAFRIESRCVHPSRAEPDLNGIPVSRWRDSSGKLHELDGIWFKLELDAREEGSGWMQIVLLGIARRGPDAHMGLALTLASESDGAGAGKSVRRREDGSGCRKGDRFRRLGVFHYNVENSGLPGSDTWPLEQMEIV